MIQPPVTYTQDPDETIHAVLTCACSRAMNWTTKPVKSGAVPVVVLRDKPQSRLVAINFDLPTGWTAGDDGTLTCAACQEA